VIKKKNKKIRDIDKIFKIKYNLYIITLNKIVITVILKNNWKCVGVPQYIKG